MKFDPKPNQVELIEHGIKSPLGVWFAEMGLSKTAARLAVWDHLFATGDLKGVLLVGPLRVVTMTWVNEIQKWDQFRWMKIANLRTEEGIKQWEEGSAQVYAINYDMLVKFATNHIKGRPIKDLPVNEVFFDELDKAKGHDSKRINQFRKLTRRKNAKTGEVFRIFPRWFGQTGTPIGNNRTGLFSQIRLIDDGERFGLSFMAWRDTHFEPENWRSDFPKWKLRKGHEEVLEEAISDIAVVQTKKEFGDWDDPVVKDLPVTLPKEVKQQYLDLETSYLTGVGDGSVVTADFEGVLPNKLLQMCSGNVYVQEDEFSPREVVHLHDEKINALKKLQKDLWGQPLLIGCSYVFEKELIKEALVDCHEFSDELEQPWNEGKVRAIVAHPLSIGHGLNLQHGGKNVVWFTRPWSPELYAQFNARLARRGQDEEVTVWRIITQDTIDEVLTESLRAKQNDQRKFMDNLRRMRMS